MRERVREQDRRERASSMYSQVRCSLHNRHKHRVFTIKAITSHSIEKKMRTECVWKRSTEKKIIRKESNANSFNGPTQRSCEDSFGYFCCIQCCIQLKTFTEKSFLLIGFSHPGWSDGQPVSSGGFKTHYTQRKCLHFFALFWSILISCLSVGQFFDWNESSIGISSEHMNRQFEICVTLCAVLTVSHFNFGAANIWLTARVWLEDGAKAAEQPLLCSFASYKLWLTYL